MIKYKAVKLIHKISFEDEPSALTQNIFHNMVRSDVSRAARKPSMKKAYKTKKVKNSFFHRSIFIYNNTPDIIRTQNRKKFSKSFKVYNSRNTHFASMS